MRWLFLVFLGAVIVDPGGSMVSDATSSLFAGSSSISGVRAFDGVLDELRLSSVSRSSGWIATQYANHADPATFMTVSAPL